MEEDDAGKERVIAQETINLRQFITFPAAGQATRTLATVPQRAHPHQNTTTKRTLSPWGWGCNKTSWDCCTKSQRRDWTGPNWTTTGVLWCFPFKVLNSFSRICVYIFVEEGMEGVMLRYWKLDYNGTQRAIAVLLMMIQLVSFNSIVVVKMWNRNKWNTRLVGVPRTDWLTDWQDEIQ